MSSKPTVASIWIPVSEEEAKGSISNGVRPQISVPVSGGVRHSFSGEYIEARRVDSDKARGLSLSIEPAASAPRDGEIEIGRGWFALFGISVDELSAETLVSRLAGDGADLTSSPALLWNSDKLIVVYDDMFLGMLVVERDGEALSVVCSDSGVAMVQLSESEGVLHVDQSEFDRFQRWKDARDDILNEHCRESKCQFKVEIGFAGAMSFVVESHSETAAKKEVNEILSGAAPLGVDVSKSPNVSLSRSNVKAIGWLPDMWECERLS